MFSDKKIEALFHLIDDPDEEVYSLISHQLLQYGNTVKPQLEVMLETDDNLHVQERVGLLLQQIHYRSIYQDFADWKESPVHSLSVAALLLCKLQDAEFTTAKTISELEKIRRTIWLELNNYLTPLEEINVIGTILYNYFSFGTDQSRGSHPKNFLLDNLLKSRKGNQYGNGLLYLLLCDALDIPVKAINLPNMFLLAYFRNNSPVNIAGSSKPIDKIELFIDPANGSIYAKSDIIHYLNQHRLEQKDDYFQPSSNITVTTTLLNEFKSCLNTETETEKINVIKDIVTLLGT